MSVSENQNQTPDVPEANFAIGSQPNLPRDLGSLVFLETLQPAGGFRADIHSIYTAEKRHGNDIVPIVEGGKILIFTAPAALDEKEKRVADELLARTAEIYPPKQPEA